MLQLPSASWPWKAVLLYMSLLFRTWRSLPKTALAVLRPYCHPPLGSDVSLMLASRAMRLLPLYCCFFRRPACASPVGSSAVGSISLAALPLCLQKKKENSREKATRISSHRILSHLILNYIKVHLTPTNISFSSPLPLWLSCVSLTLSLTTTIYLSIYLFPASRSSSPPAAEIETYFVTESCIPLPFSYAADGPSMLCLLLRPYYDTRQPKGLRSATIATPGFR
ncbi:hypothetical protein HDV64DRAFT_189790 [Trichoderma sp. TUCIM 5745]